MYGKIVNWMSQNAKRIRVLKDFNEDCRESFINQKTYVLLQASTSIGCAEYKHSFSKFLASGFRIKADASKVLSKDEIILIGNGILANEQLVRILTSLGWDTLEILDANSSRAMKWRLRSNNLLNTNP